MKPTKVIVVLAVLMVLAAVAPAPFMGYGKAEAGPAPTKNANAALERAQSGAIHTGMATPPPPKAPDPIMLPDSSKEAAHNVTVSDTLSKLGNHNGPAAEIANPSSGLWMGFLCLLIGGCGAFAFKFIADKTVPSPKA